MSERAVTACVTRASLAPARVSGSLSCYLGGPGLDPFRGTPHKERIGVEREHHVQGTTRVLFPCHLERPQDALGPHGQRRRAGRSAIYLDTNSYHSGPPSASEALYAPFTPLLLHIGNSSAKCRQQRYAPGQGLDQTHPKRGARSCIEHPSAHACVLRCGVMRDVLISTSGGRCETGEADGASGDRDGLFGPG